MQQTHFTLVIKYTRYKLHNYFSQFLCCCLGCFRKLSFNITENIAGKVFKKGLIEYFNEKII